MADLIVLRDEKTVLSKFYQPWLYHKATLAILALAGLYCASCPMTFVGIHGFLSHIPLLAPVTMRIIGISLLIFCLSQAAPVQKLFEIKPLLTLGELSFPIYAFHWPLMLTVEAGLFKFLMGKGFSYDVSAVSGLLVTVVVIIAVAYLINRITNKFHPSASAIVDKLSI